MEVKPNSNIQYKIADLVEAVVGAAFAIIFFIFINAFYRDILFLNQDFDQVRMLYNISLIVSIAIHLSRIVIRNKTYKAATEIVSSIFLVAIAYQLWTIFPFNTSVIGNKDTWDSIFRALIIIPAVGACLSIVVNFVKLVVSGFDAQLGDAKVK